MKLPPELIAVLNSEADRISSAKIGDGLTVALKTGLSVFTIVQKNGTSITLRKDIAVRCDDDSDPLYYPCHDGTMIEVLFVRWIDEDGTERRGWKHPDGGSVYLGRYPVIGD